MPVRVACLGDSITVGQFIAPSERWSTLLQQSLDEALGPGAVEVINLGLNGETTRGGLERFPAAIQALEPDVLTLQYGMNDCNCWVSDRGAHRVSIEAYRANLMEMLDRSRRFGIRHTILMTNPRSLRLAPMCNGEIYEEANARYSSAMRDVAAAADVRLCDVRAAFSGLTRKELEHLVLPPPDCLHLSKAGHVKYAETLLPYVHAAVTSASDVVLR